MKATVWIVIVRSVRAIVTMGAVKIIFLFAFLFCGSLQAQDNFPVVKGVLADKSSKQALVNATVSLQSEKDSSIFFTVVTSSAGSFEITGMDTGSYQLKASYLSMELLNQRIRLVKDFPLMDLDTIFVLPGSQLMQEVVIKEQKPPVIIKGDTIAYRGSQYKTPPGATVEDLLKKLPGVQVDQSGTVKAQGEQVQKIYVDGKEFFGNDPALATKNLTADMIEQVQVFNDKTEQAKLTNIEDGNKIKAINLKLKKDKKKGLFGTAVAGYGTDNLYHAGISANYFKSATQLSFIAGSSNLSRAAAISPVQMASPGNINTIAGRNRNGLSQTSSIGLNFHSFIGKGLDLTASYRLLDEDNHSQRISYRQSFFKDSMMTTDRSADYFAQNKNHHFNLKATATIDSLNTIVFTNALVLRAVQATYVDRFTDQVHQNESKYLSGKNQNSSSSSEKPVGWTNQLAWRKTFRLKGRSLVAVLNGIYNQDDKKMYSDLQSRLYNQEGKLYRAWDRNYFTEFETGKSNYGLAFSYTEPAGKNKWAELNLEYNNQKSRSDRNTWSYDPLTQAYDHKKDSLSNDFLQQNLSGGIGANLKGKTKNLNYQLGLSWQQMLLKTDDLSKNNFLSKRFMNLQPLLSFSYQFDKGKNLQLQYRGRTNQPDIRQLQDITDISSYPYIQKGNPGLRQEFVHTAYISYSSFNSAKLRSLFLHVTYNHIRNRITNSLQQLGAEQIWMPVNLNGAYSMNVSMGLGFPFFTWEGATLNTNTQLDVYRNVSLVNHARNHTRDFNIGQDLVLNYNSGKNLDLGISLSSAYNEIRYEIAEMQPEAFFTHSFTLNSTYSFSKGFTVSTLLDFTRYTGSSGPFNTNYLMWRAAIDQKLFRGKASMKLTINDILNSNQNISRIKGTNYTEEARTIGLGRFAVVSFIYRFHWLGVKGGKE